MKMKIIKAMASMCNGMDKFNDWFDKEEALLKKLSLLFVLQGVVYLLADIYGYTSLVEIVEGVVTVVVVIGYYIFRPIVIVQDVEVELVEEGHEHGSISSVDRSDLGQWLDLYPTR